MSHVCSTYLPNCVILHLIGGRWKQNKVFTVVWQFPVIIYPPNSVVVKSVIWTESDVILNVVSPTQLVLRDAKDQERCLIHTP